MSKAHHPAARAILGACAVLAVVSTAAAQSAVCAKPTPGLKAGQGTVYATTDAFWEDSQKYPIDIFSDVAPLGGPLLCVLYEVENISGRDIVRFSWPLASDMDLEVLPHQGPDKRQSVSRTVPIGKFGQGPVPKDTWLYAFRSGVVKTQAYQAATLDVQQKSRYALLGGSERFPAAGNRASDAKLAQLVLPDLSPEFPLNQPAEFPTVGARFSGSGAQIVANSKASRDGRAYTISVTIGRNSADFARDIKAPFTSALQKASSVASLLANVEERRNVTLSLEGNTLQATITIKAEPVTKALYLVEQPIIFQRNDGRACFRAPVYSPVPLPERFLSCGLR